MVFKNQTHQISLSDYLTVNLNEITYKFYMKFKLLKRLISINRFKSTILESLEEKIDRIKYCKKTRVKLINFDSQYFFIQKIPIPIFFKANIRKTR